MYAVLAIISVFCVSITSASAATDEEVATLSNIWVGTGTLTPAFNAEVTEYTVDVATSVTTVWMNADTSVVGAQYHAGGAWRSSGSSWSNSLAIGANKIEIIGRSIDQTTTKVYTVTVNRAEPPIVVSPAAGALTAGKIGTPYSLFFTATRGTAPYVYQLSSGALPAGITLSSGGALSGTPTAGGTFSFTLKVSDDQPISVTQNHTLTIAVPTLAFSPVTVPAAIKGEGYSQTITASGGTPGYTFSISAGTLPLGITLNSNGVLEGTASSAGSYTFQVKAVDSSTGSGPFTIYRYYTLAVNDALPIANAVSAAVDANSSNNDITLDITGGTASSVLVSQTPSHGTTSVSGGAISYTPTPGYSGADSFTYSAKNASGTSSPAVVSIDVKAPTLALSPATGDLPEAIAGESYSGVAIFAANGTAPYEYKLTAGILPDGLSLDTLTGTISGKAIATGKESFTITATDTYGATGLGKYTIVVGEAVPVANVVSATVYANSAKNNIALDISGGAAESVDVTVGPKNGSASVSGTLITYTPNPGFSGLDSFTYTATNTSGTSAGAVVSITVGAPVFAFTPPAGMLAEGVVGSSYSGVTVSAEGGAAPYQYAVTAGVLPSGISLDPVTGKISGTPSAKTKESFTITATDANGAKGVAKYTIVVADAVPVAKAVSASVEANSTNTKIALDLGGGLAESVSVSVEPQHGITTVSGTTISYTPNAGYSGSDSFSYTASNASGTSAAAIVSITVTAPSFNFSPAAGNLPEGLAGTVYEGATINASGGAEPYIYSVTAGSLPDGLTLDASSGKIAGTPTKKASETFTISAKDANGASGSTNYRIVVSAAAEFVFSPASGALSDAMAGEKYTRQISANGGAGSLAYATSSGTLPKGLALAKSGELSGTPAEGSEGAYKFAVQVSDSTGATGEVSYSLTVREREVAVTDKVINVEAGSSPNNVNLAAGATGGPFTAAELTFVEPSNAGTATIVNGEFAQASTITATGWYLKFIPNRAFSGKARVGFKLTSALGASNTGTVTYNLGYSAADVASDIDNLVHGFVEARQNMISSNLKVPGLMERRQMASSTESVTTNVSPSAQGLTLGFSTSLAQIESARDNADGIAAGEMPLFNIWVDGVFLAHNRNDNGNKWGNFGMINAGVDYLVHDKALIGLSIHYDRMTDPTDEDAELTGNGWLVGPYASFEIGKGVFWDTSLLYGGSSNEINTPFWDGDFDTSRWLLDTAIKGQWAINEDTVFTPKIRAVYFSEEVDDYAVLNSSGDSIELNGFTEEQLRVSIGGEISKQIKLGNDLTLNPKLGLTAGVSGLDGSGAFGSASIGASLQTADSWSIDASFLFGLEGDGQKSVGGKIGISSRF